MALSATLSDPAKSITNAILIYDNGGWLTQLWDTAPYHHHQIAAGPDGSIYGFGDRSDAPSKGGAQKDIALLIHYSKDGKAMQESLRASLFPKDVEIVGADSNTGLHQMFFSGQSLYLYVAPTR
jgi:hypothetical protein